MEYDIITLASNSPRRRQLLTEAHIPFETASHCFDESLVSRNIPPTEAVIEIAYGKANSLGDNHDYDDKYILGVDTIVAYDGRIFGKPHDARQALETMRLLSGRTHQVLSGVSIVNRAKNISLTRAAVSDVTFARLSDEFLDYYIQSKSYEGYAGGYAIQGIFSTVVSKISGSYTNIVGLPMELLYQMLHEIGFRMCL